MENMQIICFFKSIQNIFSQVPVTDGTPEN